MSLNREDVKTLANLARLKLSDEELTIAEKELDNILAYVDRLSSVKTTDVEPLTVPAKSDGWREDVVFSCDEVTREFILSNFPVRRGDLLKTPGVFEHPKGGR